MTKLLDFKKNKNKELEPAENLIKKGRRYQAIIINPLGAKTYVGPSLDSKQIGLLRKRQSVRILAEENGFGLVGESPVRWCLLEDVESIDNQLISKLSQKGKANK